MLAVGLSIQGIHSRKHARSAHSALEVIPGVQKVEVRLTRGEARVSYDPEKVVAPQQFQVALFVMGFTLKALSQAKALRAPARLAVDIRTGGNAA